MLAVNFNPIQIDLYNRIIGHRLTAAKKDSLWEQRMGAMKACSLAAVSGTYEG